MESSNSAIDPKKGTGRWSNQEHQRFMLGLMNYGKDWKKVQDVVGTRSGSQVRSHAQKFFNKLQKNPKDKRTQNRQKAENGHEDEAQINQNSLTQNDTMKGLIQQQNSDQTPLELVSLIRKQSHDTRKINLTSFKKKLEEKQEKQQQNNQNLKGLSSFKSMDNILSAYEALNQNKGNSNHLEEDESFLIGITKKYKRFFSKGGQFQSLIDFGNPHEVEKAGQIYKSIRKKSFTLAEGIEGDQNDLQDIKNKLKECKQAPPSGQRAENKKIHDLKQCQKVKQQQGSNKSGQKLIQSSDHQAQSFGKVQKIVQIQKVNNQQQKI